MARKKEMLPASEEPALVDGKTPVPFNPIQGAKRREELRAAVARLIEQEKQAPTGEPLCCLITDDTPMYVQHEVLYPLKHKGYKADLRDQGGQRFLIFEMPM